MMIVNEETSVEAQFDVDGEITPRRFAWRGSMVPIEGVGRRWEEGDERCFMVMAMGGQPFELRLNERKLCWRIARAPAPRLTA
ncbi:MAG: hypothetical protein JXA14_23225 [Anaerolineae bacterium]|nr:hypothetical protein [Anaerolineae bacterium]